MLAGWQPKSEVKYFVLQRAKLCGSCAGGRHNAQWPPTHTIICWFCHLKSEAAGATLHHCKSLNTCACSAPWRATFRDIPLAQECVCTFFGNYAGAAEIVDSYGWLRYANSTGCKSGKLLMHVAVSAHAHAPSGNSVATPRELAKSSAQGRMHMQLPRYCCSSSMLLATTAAAATECCSNWRCCCCYCCCCFWAINQRAKVKHWLTIQSTDLNWRIYLRNDCARAAPNCRAGDP